MARSSSRRMKMLTREFFLEGKRLWLEAKDTAANCWLCKQPIDYNVDPHTTDDSHNLDHYHSVSEHPELQEDPSNFRHAHMLCNNKRSNNAPTLGLGPAVPDWW